MTESLGIAVIGLGAAARNIHLPAIGKIGDLRIVGGVDPVADPARFPFPVFRSTAELWSAVTPDIVAIVTPPDSHYALTLEALGRGAHVFCEKPFVLTLEEGRTVIARAAEARRQVVVNNEFRFMNVHEAARGAIGSRDFGDLLFVSIHQTFHVTETTESGWRGASRRRTCFEFGTHALDLCRYFFGEEPWAISARMPKPGRPDGPDYLNLIQLEFSGDRVAHITLDRLSRGPHRYLDIRLDGTEACIETRLGGQAQMTVGIRGGSRRPFVQLDLAPSASAHLLVGDRRRRLATDPGDLFPHSTAKLLGAMVAALRTGATPPCSAADNIHTLALMLAAYDSSDEGGLRRPLEALTPPDHVVPGRGS
ncbi:MAG: Gfo/Idh/MocA family protein [Pseudomonadota bacterium]